MATGAYIEANHRDRGDLILDLELEDWIAWEQWSGRSFATFGDEDKPPGAKDLTYLSYEAAKRTGVHDGDLKSWTRSLDGFPQFRYGQAPRPTQPAASDDAA